MTKVYNLTPRQSELASPGFASIEEILAELRSGRIVVILDDEDRENEGDLIMAAECVTPESVAFMIRHTSGILCVPMEAERLARLDLPQMVPNNDDAFRTAFTVSVDYRFGTTTGVSSSDRAATIRALADPNALPKDFARQHGLKIGTIADLIRHRLRTERSVDRIGQRTVQTEFGEFQLYVYEDRVHHLVHFALARGNLDGATPPLVRVHIADTLRDLLGIRGDAKAWTLRAALERIAHAGSGALVILRNRESAEALAETVRAADASAPPPGASAGDHGQVLRTYGLGAQILKDMGVRRMRVLSAPKQMHGISAFDLEIEGYVSEES